MSASASGSASARGEVFGEWRFGTADLVLCEEKVGAKSGGANSGGASGGPAAAPGLVRPLKLSGIDVVLLREVLQHMTPSEAVCPFT